MDGMYFALLHWMSLELWYIYELLLCLCCHASCRFNRLRLELATYFGELHTITSAREVATTMFQKAVEACIINMQNVIESLCHSLSKQAAKRAATAGRQWVFLGCVLAVFMMVYTDTSDCAVCDQLDINVRWQ